MNLPSESERTAKQVWIRRTIDCVDEFWSNNADELSAAALDQRDLVRQSLLHVPILMPSDMNHTQRIEEIIVRQFSRLNALRRQFGLDRIFNRCVVRDVKESRLVNVDADESYDIHRYLHYLLSPRTSSINLGLACKEIKEPFALASFSSFDIPHLERIVRPYFYPEQVLVLSRFFAFPSAPKNAVSFLMRKSRQWIRQNYPEIRLILTYTNPNVGFSASSLSASNWTIIAHEEKDYYLYFDGVYTTDRELSWKYGVDDFSALQAKLGNRIARSKIPLEPLRVHATLVRSSDSVQIKSWTPQTVSIIRRHQ